MKIYQVIEFGGQYEDYYEAVIGTFLDKEKAIIEMNKKIEEQKCIESQYEMCYECEINKKRLSKPCFKHLFGEYMPFDRYYCIDEVHFLDEIHYKIKEFEVRE